MSFFDSILEFFGWTKDEAEAEASEVELVVNDVRLAFDGGSLTELEESLDAFDEIAERLGLNPSDLSDEDTEVILQLIPDFKAEADFQIERDDSEDGDEVQRDEAENGVFISYAEALGAESGDDVENAIGQFYETEYQLAATFETAGEALEYVEGVSAGVLEIVEGDDGLFYVYRTYKDD